MRLLRVLYRYACAMSSRVAAIVFKLVVATMSLTAVSVQFFAVTVAEGHSVFNFFCYFTNLSNIMISIVFIVGALRLIRGTVAPSNFEIALRGAAVVYIVFVGIVFNTILADGDVGPVIPWVNVVVHMIVPLAGLIDWIAWPPRKLLPISLTLWWMIWPATYSLFSIARGAGDGFYPYPFYNPSVSGGYLGVALWCLTLIVTFFVLALALRWVANARTRRLFLG